MTKDEFEKWYADRIDVTVAWLHDNGLVAMSCDCGDTMCHGWVMVAQLLQSITVGTI